ncbi:hypothetical protein A2U01_0107403, partial [Trifolium medium]|nr:hypothetical protein [Trifolium medium]
MWQWQKKRQFHIEQE